MLAFLHPLYCLLFLMVYGLFDLAWLKLSASVHKNMIEKVQQSPAQFQWWAAGLYYLLVPTLLFFLVRYFASSWKEALVLGGGMAFMMFLTFDLTNKAIFSRYPTTYALMDITVGTTSIFTALALTVGFALWWQERKKSET